GCTKAKGPVDIDMIAMQRAAEVDEDEIPLFDLALGGWAVMRPRPWAGTDHAPDPGIATSLLHHGLHDGGLDLGLHDVWRYSIASGCHGAVSDRRGSADDGDLCRRFHQADAFDEK